MWNELIDDLIINHSPIPLFEQERIHVLDAKEMESSSKINLKDASWWMSIKDACRPQVPVITKLSKEGCIFLVVGGRLL
jgi:hypothetical protein